MQTGVVMLSLVINESTNHCVMEEAITHVHYLFKLVSGTITV